MPGMEPTPLIVENIKDDLPDFGFRQGIDIGDPLVQKLRWIPAVEGAGRGVGIHDPHRIRLDEEHDRPIVCKKRTIPALRRLELAPVQKENRNENTEEKRDAEEQKRVIVKFLWHRNIRGVSACFSDGIEPGRDGGGVNILQLFFVRPSVPPYRVTGPRHMPYLYDAHKENRDRIVDLTWKNMVFSLALRQTTKIRHLSKRTNSFLFIIYTNCRMKNNMLRDDRFSRTVTLTCTLQLTPRTSDLSTSLS